METLLVVVLWPMLLSTETCTWLGLTRTRRKLLLYCHLHTGLSSLGLYGTASALRSSHTCQDSHTLYWWAHNQKMTSQCQSTSLPMACPDFWNMLVAQAKWETMRMSKLMLTETKATSWSQWLCLTVWVQIIPLMHDVGLSDGWQMCLLHHNVVLDDVACGTDALHMNLNTTMHMLRIPYGAHTIGRGSMVLRELGRRDCKQEYSALKN